MRRILTVAAILAVALYAGYWFVLAGQIENGFERWVAEARERGDTVEFETTEVGGFPLDVTLSTGPLRYAWSTATRGGEWTGGGFEASMGTGDPQRVDVAFAGAQKVRLDRDGPVGPLEIAWPGPSSAELVGDGEGHLSEARIEAADVTLTDEASGLRYRADQVSLDARRTEAKDDAPPAMLVDLLLDRLTLPDEAGALLGSRIERAELSVDMTHPPVFGAERFDPERWRAAGGTLFVRELRVVWGGVEGEASGELRLDGRLQPAGQLQLSIAGYDRALQAAVEAGQIERQDADTLRNVLNLFASTGDDGTRTVSAPMTIRDRGLYVGPLQVAKLPPVDWSALTEP